MIEEYQGESQFSIRRKALDVCKKMMQDVEIQTQQRAKREERKNALRSVEHDQLSGMRRTSNILNNQISLLENQIENSHFYENQQKIAAGEAPPVGELLKQQADLMDRKEKIDRQWFLGTANRRMSELDTGTKQLLRAYNGGAGLLNNLSAEHQLKQKGYSTESIKSLAEFEQYMHDYQNSVRRGAEMRKFAEEAPALATAASVTMAPLKAAGLVEMARGVLPKGLGGYYNEGKPINIYSKWFVPTQNVETIRSTVMEDMTPAGKVVYTAGTEIIDGITELIAAKGISKAFGMSSEMAKASTEKTMSWLSASKAATDAVYYGIQSGKSNSEALIDGIVKGTVGILTDKISPGAILDTMLGDKKGWQGMLRTFLSEGTEEVTEVWAERIFDIVSEQDESEVRQTYRSYIEHGATPAEALLRLCGKYAMEDSEAFFVAGVTGVAIEKASNLFSSKGKQYDKAEPGDIESEAEFDKAFEKGYNEDDDLLELEKLQNSLGQNAPQSIKEYQDLKYGDQWGAYQAYANAIESGNLSPMADFGLYQSKSAEIDKVLIGVQAANGTTITGKSDLFTARTIGSVSKRQSGISPQAVRYAVTHPTVISPIKIGSNGRTQRLRSNRVWVLLNLDTGTIIEVGMVMK